MQLFYMDVEKVDRDVAYAVSVSEACCKRLLKVFLLFQTYVACVLILMLHIFHTYVTRVCSKYFSCFILFWSTQLFHSYDAVSIFIWQVFYLDIAYVSHICCNCMFQIFHLV